MVRGDREAGRQAEAHDAFHEAGASSRALDPFPRTTKPSKTSFRTTAILDSGSPIIGRQGAHRIIMHQMLTILEAQWVINVP